MEYTVFTYGGGQMLVSIFNSIAMIFKSNNTYLTPVGTFAMGAGALYASMLAIYRASLANFASHWLMPSLISYTLLFAPKASVWVKDEIDPMHQAAVKIDNIPFGIAFATSISSTISHELSKLFEEVLLPVDRITNHVGIMYGTKAIAKIRDSQITDPILLRNTKEYMRQCYMKPYVIGNFGNHKAAAIKSDNILAYLESNPVKVFGIKYTGEDGTSEFMTCTTAGAAIRTAMDNHMVTSNILSRLGAAIGLNAENQDAMHFQVKAMATDALGFLESGQQNVHEWVKQAMILNANRESYDDWREKVGHNRVFPELIKMQATRGNYQQALGSIVGGEMAEGMIPVAAQPVMLALVMLCFVIILPLSLLPGGWSYIMTGMKLMIWVGSWPVFYTIIHALSMVALKSSVSSWGVGGLSLIGQGGFTEIIMMRYAYTQSLISAVPLISFAIVFGSPYALSSIAGSAASVASANAIGSNMADGSLSMNQISYGNSTKHNRQEAPSLLMGSGVIDDGAMRVQSDNSGNQFITEYQDNLAVNYKASESFSGQINDSLSNARSKMGSIRESQVEQESALKGQSVDLARAVSQGNISSDSISTSDRENLSKLFNYSNSASKTDSASDVKTDGTNAHLNLKPPGFIAAATGIDAGAGASASNIDELRKSLDKQERISFDKSLAKVYEAVKSGNYATNNSADTKLGRNISANLNKLDQLSSEYSNTKQDVDTYSNQLSYLQSNSGTIDRNVNSQVISKVMEHHPELRSKQQATSWMQSHRGEADNIAKGVIANNNPFADEKVQQQVTGLKQNTAVTSNIVVPQMGSLTKHHQENVSSVTAKAVVRGGGGSQSLESAVNNKLSDDSQKYNSNTTELLKNQLSNEELGIYEKREQEQAGKEDTIMGGANNEIGKKKQDKFDSTIIRTGVTAANAFADTTSPVLEVTKPVGSDYSPVGILTNKIKGDKNDKD